MNNPNFDPEKVKRYVWESRGQGDPGAVMVLARDYNQLLDLYKELKWMYEELCK